ncbi:hypothetical protein AUP68_06106 [Ilyonectria robusta]
MEISCYSSSFRELHLDDIAFDTGHILVHFLHTGSYQCLKPQGDTTAKRHTSEFATALRTYVAAQSLQLLSLRDLAKGEMIRLGNKLSVLSLIDILEEPTSSLSTSPGIVAYAESRFLAFAESITHPIAEKVLIEIGTPNTLSKVLLKTILLLKTSEVLQRDGSFQKKVLVEILRGLTDSKPGAGASTSKVSDLDQAMQEAEEKVAREVEEQTAKEETSAKEEKPAEAEDKPADDVETLEEKKFAEAAPPADEEKNFEDIPAEECKPSEDDEVAEVIPPAGELKPIDEEEEKTAAQEAEDVVIALEEAELAALVAKKAKSKKHKLNKTNAQRFSILTENAAKRAEAKAVAAPAAAESAPPVDEEEIFEATPTEEDKTSADTPNDEDKPAEAIPPAEEDEPAESRVASTDHSFVFPTPKIKPCDNKDDLDPYRLQATGDMGFPELASAENPKLNAFHWGGYIRVSPSSPASDNSSLHI